MMNNKAWNGFQGGRWQRRIDVRSFVQRNYQPYTGDDAFLAAPTARTKKLWDKCMDLLKAEQEKGGVLSVDPTRVSTITSHGAGYIEKDLEVGLRISQCSFEIANFNLEVMNDGVSYRIPAAQQTYSQDRASPGFNTFDGSSALVKRPGIHGFFRPHSAKGVWLQSSPQKVVIPAPPHYQKSYSLMGRASTYEVVPSTGSTIYLSTPGALAKKSDASFWRINTAKLGELIERAHIVLNENTLTLGSVKVLLPPVTDPSVPLEQVSVLTKLGEQYDIRQDLGGIYLAQLDASPYQTVAEVWEALRRSRQWSTLMARQLRVIGLELSDGTVSGVHYDSGRDCWGADVDPLRTVTSADLRFSGVDSV